MSENELESVQVNEQVADKAKKIAPKPSSEQKEIALQLLRDGKSINEVVEETNIGIDAYVNV